MRYRTCHPGATPGSDGGGDRHHPLDELVVDLLLERPFVDVRIETYATLLGAQLCPDLAGVVGRCRLYPAAAAAAAGRTSRG